MTTTDIGGFERRAIDLSNWRNRPYSSWAFQNVGELIPSAIVRGTGAKESPLQDLGGLAGLRLTGDGNAAVALPLFLEQTSTDSFVVMRGGAIAAEWHAPGCDPSKPHIIFSISKSFTGLLAGILASLGLVSPDDPVVRHVPEMAGSAFGDATLRDLLDMQVSMDFAEDYLDKTGGYDRYRRATGWNPAKPGETIEDLLTFLATIRKGPAEHGTAHAYRSPNTDLAGIVLERAAGRRFHELLETLLWQPMGAHGDAAITVDRAGTARAAGGISVTARDLARLGELVRTGGGGIVPPSWIEDIRTAGNREIWKAGDQAHHFADGSYRSYWYDTGEGELAAIGIHGQWIWIDFAREVVIARQASQPLPTDPELSRLLVAMYRAVVKAV